MSNRLFLSAAIVVAFTAVLGAQNRQELQVNADLRILQEQVQKLQVTVNQLTDRGKATEGRLDTVASASQRSFADQKLATDQITNTLGNLREKSDENNTRVLQLTQEIAALREGLKLVTTQLNTLVSLLQPTGAPADAGAQAGTGSTLGSVVMPPSATSYYQAAMADYMTGKFDLAISGFKEVIEKFGTSPQAADAQFYVAESLYSQSKCQQAIAEYDRLTKNYKESKRLPDAYLMQGVCYDDLKQTTKANAMYKQVLSLFPNSDAATQAQQQLNRKN
jgi:tol-pal system protein YbgF